MAKEFATMELDVLLKQLTSRFGDIVGNVSLGTDHISKVSIELKSDIQKSSEILEELTRRLDSLYSLVK